MRFLFSSHLKLLFQLQKGRVCIPSPSAAVYVYSYVAKHFSKFTCSILCVEMSISYLPIKRYIPLLESKF